jgi:hypothetical protein
MGFDRSLHLAATGFLACALSSCSEASGNSRCSEPERLGTLPAEIHDASGLTASSRFPGMFWTFNDSKGGPVLYAVDLKGAVHARVQIRGASNYDWEDISIGPCPTGSCLYISDTGDNHNTRPFGVVYRIPEPALDATEVEAERYPIRYPDFPRDVEASFVLGSGDIYFVTKGKRAATAVFRYPAPLFEDSIFTVVPVQALAKDKTSIPSHFITGADATMDGSLIAIRSASTLKFYHYDAGRFIPFDEPLNLKNAHEPRGEGVTILPDGTIILVSEGTAEDPGLLTRIRCEW